MQGTTIGRGSGKWALGLLGSVYLLGRKALFRLDPFEVPIAYNVHIGKNTKSSVSVERISIGWHFQFIDNGHFSIFDLVHDT